MHHYVSHLSHCSHLHTSQSSADNSSCAWKSQIFTWVVRAVRLPYDVTACLPIDPWLTHFLCTRTVFDSPFVSYHFQNIDILIIINNIGPILPMRNLQSPVSEQCQDTCKISCAEVVHRVKPSRLRPLNHPQPTSQQKPFKSRVPNLKKQLNTGI